VHPIADALAKAGIDVWIDHLRMSEGTSIPKGILEALASPRWVVVFWSQASVRSDYVLSEAEIGRQRDVLVPVKLDPSVEPPPPFTTFKARSLATWGQADDPSWVALLERLKIAPSYRTKNAPTADREIRTQPTAPSGAVFRDHADAPVLVSVALAPFMMGSPTSEPGRHLNESPTRMMSLSGQLAVGRYPVTFDEWDAAAARGACGGYMPDDEGWGRGERPVINVSWQDSQAYLDWASKVTGMRYRLLSESEWEYCCRAGGKGPFSSGSVLDSSLANFDSAAPDALNGRRAQALDRTSRVGVFDPNRFGLCDFHGNVREWTLDAWADNHLSRPDDGAPLRVAENDLRPVRGGSWFDPASDQRSARRAPEGKNFRSPSIGFRIAREL